VCITSDVSPGWSAFIIALKEAGQMWRIDYLARLSDRQD
jgi:hypothetical protein